MRILVVEEDGQFRLYSESAAGRNPAGSWPFREGGEYPIERYVYATREAADDAARALEAYLTSYHATRQGKRKPARSKAVRKHRKGPDLRGDQHQNQPTLWD